MLAGRVARACAALASQELVMTPAHVTTQLITRTDVELTKTVCEIHEDDVLDRARRVLVYVLDLQAPWAATCTCALCPFTSMYEDRPTRAAW